MDTSVRPSTEQALASAAERAAMHDVPYCEAVGALNQAVLTTCPDIALAVASVARFTANPSPMHWETIKRIYRYPAGTLDPGLPHGETKRTLEGYAEADSSMAEDRRATIGCAVLVDGSAISRPSNQQGTMSLSTTESKCTAKTLSEALGTPTASTTLFPINQTVIPLTCDHQYHLRTKNIDVHYQIHRLGDQTRIPMHHLLLDRQYGHPLTKALPSVKVMHFAEPRLRMK